MQEGTPAISSQDLSKRFGPVEALRNVTLDIPVGVTFGLLGPNGAGKTTFIRVLLGLTPPSSGTARILDESIPPRAALSNIGYMPQNLAIYPDLTVRENLALFGRLLGMDEATIRRRSRELLELVELVERRDDLVSTLSSGMKRRTSLAAALLHDPDLLLLDEPTVGIDPELRASFWSYFTELNSQGKTVLITTHYMEEATRCDRVGLLHRGQVLVSGTPTAIKAQTQTDNLEDAFLVLVRSSGAGTP